MTPSPCPRAHGNSPCGPAPFGVLPWRAPLLAAALLHAGAAGAQFNPATVTHEPAAMAER